MQNSLFDMLFDKYEFYKESISDNSQTIIKEFDNLEDAEKEFQKIDDNGVNFVKEEK